MKTAIEHLQDLPEWLCELAMDNVKQNPILPEKKCIDLVEAITFSFSWRKSNEGWIYWLEILKLTLKLQEHNINPKTYTKWPKP